MSGIGRHVEYAQNYVAQLTAQQAREVARESAISADKVQRNTERLYMVVQAMWELMKEKAGLSDRTILSGQLVCSWCGAQFEGGAFDHAR